MGADLHEVAEPLRAGLEDQTAVHVPDVPLARTPRVGEGNDLKEDPVGAAWGAADAGSSSRPNQEEVADNRAQHMEDNDKYQVAADAQHNNLQVRQVSVEMALLALRRSEVGLAYYRKEA